MSEAIEILKAYFIILNTTLLLILWCIFVNYMYNKIERMREQRRQLKIQVLEQKIKLKEIESLRKKIKELKNESQSV